MFLDEFAPGRNIIAHEHGEYPVGFSSAIDGNLTEGTVFRVHGGIPELFGVHFTQTFIPLYMHAGPVFDISS